MSMNRKYAKIAGIFFLLLSFCFAGILSPCGVFNIVKTSGDDAALSSLDVCTKYGAYSAGISIALVLPLFVFLFFFSIYRLSETNTILTEPVFAFCLIRPPKF